MKEEQLSNINIFQIYFNENQLFRLDEQFIPYKNGKNSKFYEFSLLLEIYEKKIYETADYSGVVSYKFNNKTGIKGEEFINFVRKNPGYDVYFINPHPFLPYFYYNCWEQGEYWHPGLKNISSKLFKKMNFLESTNNLPRQTNDVLCYANFWIGNNNFWKKYGRLLKDIEIIIEKDIDIKKELFDNTFHYNEAPIFPFVIERIFSTLLSIDKDLKYLSYPITKEALSNSCLYDFERIELKKNKELIDVYDSNKEIEKLKEFFETNSEVYYRKAKEHVFHSGIPKKMS